MKSPFKVLYLEDEKPTEGEVLGVLEHVGINYCVEEARDRVAFQEALANHEVDLIISDRWTGAFNALEALKQIRSEKRDVPFLVISEDEGEQVECEVLELGAVDFILRKRLGRLIPAIRRALKEVEDLAQRKRLEAQFIESQKMELVGQLASGVAHDFNNILGVIMGYSDSVIAELDPNHSMRPHIEEIRMAAERSAGLAKQLLIFSRKQTVDPVVIDLNTVVGTMEKMLRRLIGENVELSIQQGKKLGRIKADSGYVGQVLMNLVINARDAMPQGGSLRIETLNKEVTVERKGEIGMIPPGEYVVLTVQDTGEGMDEVVKKHLFEAFFTTKPKGKGTGLGLSTCQTIVEKSGGFIDFSSEFGKGTTFLVYFPRVEQPLDAQSRVSSSRILPGGSETLLLVEDDPALSRLACGVLQKLGYSVLMANNGQDGLKMASQNPGNPISLVITDVIMPQMGGKAMAEWLKSFQPDMKILFTSGYTDDALAHHGMLESGVSFLPKPYTPGILARKVREMLDK